MNFSFNKTKIIATVGPSCNKKEQLFALAQAGVDVFRLNFSHGSHEEHAQVIAHIRDLNQEHQLNLCILQDLQGPKIRTGEVENNGVELKVGQSFVITNQALVGNAERASTTYQFLPKDVKIGETILIDDGKIELRVTAKTETDVKTEVVYGGYSQIQKGN